MDIHSNVMSMTTAVNFRKGTKMKYFLISYIYGSGGELGTGNLGFGCDTFPNYEKITELSGIGKLTVINIMEMTQEQYSEFWRK